MKRKKSGWFWPVILSVGLAVFAFTLIMEFVPDLSEWLWLGRQRNEEDLVLPLPEPLVTSSLPTPSPTTPAPTAPESTVAVTPTPTPLPQPTATPAPQLPTDETLLIQRIVRQVQPSIVTLYVSLPERVGYTVQAGLFSGVVISDEGEIVTNASNFSFARTYGGQLYDDAVVQAYLHDDEGPRDLLFLGYDKNSDVALFRLTDPPPDLIPISVNGSPELAIGDRVLALGGADLDTLGESLSLGFITALKRRSVFEDGLESGMIQTSAFITPLLSGAALLDTQGDLIGLVNSNVARNYSDTLGYALPAGVMETAIERILTDKGPPLNRKTWLGVAVMDEEDYAELAATRGFPEGLLITEIQDDSPAAAIDLRRFDVITAIDGQQMKTLSDLNALLEARQIGERIQITLFRTETRRYQDVLVYLREQRNE